MKPVLDGIHVTSIIQEYGLNDLIATGSTADLYKGDGDTLRRLSIDAGSHNILVHGSASGYNFPKVKYDYGIVGVSDENPEGRYWLLDVERCHRLTDDVDRYVPLIAALDEIDGELQGQDPADCRLARESIAKYRSVFNEYGIADTLDFSSTLRASII